MKKDKLKRFNVKNISPQGWILHQLKTQMDGLSGHLHEFWPDIQRSGWIGGDKESWERVPYWLDGYVPLAYLLKDKKAIKEAKFYIDSIIARQQEDGWIAPKSEERSKYDVWGIFIMLKALLGYAEINNDKRCYEAIYKALKALDKHIDQYPLFDWAKFRWFECLIPIYALYEKNKEAWLLDLAKKLHDQGFDYSYYYETDFPKDAVPQGEWRFDTHIVNNVMAIKCYGLYYKLTGNKKDLRIVNKMLKTVNKYHGAISGAINGDECFAGLSPNHGSELCSIVEFMYSLEVLSQIDGSNKYQEQLERLCFNALPSATTHDMWAHQYVNQVNAPFIKKDENVLWTTNGPEANIYGLEPHFGCCTANMHQGWPKFVESIAFFSNKEIQINSFVPVSVENRSIKLKIESFYPFKKEAIIKVSVKKNYRLKLLIPSWVDSFLINNEKKEKDIHGFYVFDLMPGETSLSIKFISEPKWVKRKHGVSLLDGPLVYALKVNQEQRRINIEDPLKAEPHADYEFINTSDFNYGIISKEIKESLCDVDFDKSPFVSEQSNKSIFVKCQKIKYKIKGNYVLLSKTIIDNNGEEKEFIPIGINKLHMGELPLLIKLDN